MKKETKIQLIAITVLLIILIIMLCIYFKSNNTSNEENLENKENNMSFSSDVSEKDTTIVSSKSEISSALTENIELHATYYFQECYVSENEVVEEGETILSYTNGEYLVAPYRCVIVSLNIPESEGQCTNENYIEISSLNILSVSVSVDESIIDSISIGQEATITVSAFDDKTLTGYVTNISQVASGGNFTIKIEFNNDGEVMLGMSSTVTI